ncbi:HAMP domain-containing histidine kinase [bacterium LRH843]|nr:HAMP domain-containing histidine kinase [bacterium LRH843]
MDIKWRNRLKVIGWLLLLTFGLSGMFAGLSQSNEFVKRDYFHTQEFEYELDEFIDYLSTYQLNAVTKEDAKKQINVTLDEINEHRFRFGDLSEQISTIKSGYEVKINNAIMAGNEEVASTYRAERDAKIEDITTNFKSDEHVEAKIIKEKERMIDEYFRELEQRRGDFLQYKSVFSYYLEDIRTGDIFTNVNVNSDDVGKVLNKENMLFIRNYPSVAGGNLTTNGHYIHIDVAHHSFTAGYDEVVTETVSYPTYNAIEVMNERAFTGTIAIPKTVSNTSPVVRDYYSFQQRQMIFVVCLLSGAIALILCFVLRKKVPFKVAFETERGEVWFKRIPLDVAIGIILGTILCLLISLAILENHMYYYQGDIIGKIKEILVQLLLTTFLIALTLIQGIWLHRRIAKSTFREDWKGSVMYRIYQAVLEAFSNRRVGTQVLLLLTVVYLLGVGAIFIAIEPVLIILYAFVCLLIGLPLLILLVKRIGYFNQIIAHASQVASGRVEPDLPVKGKHVLAELATNLNTMKHGVRTSRREQAKSERLKTELITNVSHDLRTPLTSIITYTELLKTPDLPEEDQKAYVQIIDQKSKRLKVLIDDLFEASKMASGSIELVKEKADIVQLLQQALAEHNERMIESDLVFRVNQDEAPIYATVDGQKLWRVFDNLIGNILNYSLEHTRVYINVTRIDDEVVIEFKNITKYELGNDSDELFERFKRGDTSRHTDGSGLGLAIAKSIVDLHGGSLDIDIDGDLFKVTVKLDAI